MGVGFGFYLKNVHLSSRGYPPADLIFLSVEMPFVSIEMRRKTGSPLEIDQALAKLNTRKFTRKA
jgi:hypothetical protein